MVYRTPSRGCLSPPDDEQETELQLIPNNTTQPDIFTLLFYEEPSSDSR
jgi:hypothetical protein